MLTENERIVNEEECVKGNPDVSKLYDVTNGKIKKNFYGKILRKVDEFDFNHVEFARIAGLSHKDIEDLLERKH